mgnify:CR=1 FL=1
MEESINLQNRPGESQANLQHIQKGLIPSEETY